MARDGNDAGPFELSNRLNEVTDPLCALERSKATASQLHSKRCFSSINILPEVGPSPSRRT